jgi:hypothetical protein
MAEVGFGRAGLNWNVRSLFWTWIGMVEVGLIDGLEWIGMATVNKREIPNMEEKWKNLFPEW